MGTRPPGPSLIQQTALVERQNYIENILYPNAPHGVNKAVTPEMKQVILKPLEECITSLSNIDNSKNGGTRKSTASLQDWQEGKVPNLSFSDFKKLVSQEHKSNLEINEALLQEVFAIRVIGESIHHVNSADTIQLDEDTQSAIKYAVAPPKGNLLIDGFAVQSQPPETFNDAQNTRFEDISSNMKKSIKVIEQMKLYGIDTTRNCYKNIHEIESADTPKKLDVVRTQIMEKYPTVREFEIESNPLAKEEIKAKGDELSKNVLQSLESKKESFNAEGRQADEFQMKEDIEEYAKKLGGQFNDGYAYLESLIPPEERRFLDKAPYYILKSAIALRKAFPVANTEVLAKIWWQMRLGGDRAKDVYEHLKTEWPAFVKRNHLERYTKHISDNYLSSEAAGFEFKKNITIPEGVTPNQMLFQTMKDLIKNHIPKDQEYVRFTILDGEQSYRKIIIPYHDGITDAEIFTNIDNATKLNRPQEVGLTDKEKAELSYKGYSASDRKKDKQYQRIYGGFGRDKKSGKDYEGDYLIQMGSPHIDSREPRSLFAVDSHKVAIQLNFHEAGKSEATFRYNHTHFDGVSATVHTMQIETGQKLLAEAPGDQKIPPMLPREKNSVMMQLTSGINNLEQEKCALPLIEARADYDDNEVYTKAEFAEDSWITQTEQRSLVIARANEGIEHFQQLYLGKAPSAYYKRNINYNNVQPVVISVSLLQQNNHISGARNLRKAVAQAQEEGVSHTALLASITGTRESFLALTGSVINPYLTNMLSHSHGMVSPIVNEGPFTTAISNAYRPYKIDLNDPVPSMGVIGMALQKKTSHYTVRLLPSQAQKQFKEAALALCADYLSPEGKQKVLSEFTKIIKEWDKLVGGTGKTISLEKYEKTRNAILQSLIDEGYIHDDKNMDTGEKLQIYLNETLQKAAKNVFNKDKMAQAKKEIAYLLDS